MTLVRSSICALLLLGSLGVKAAHAKPPQPQSTCEPYVGIEELYARMSGFTQLVFFRAAALDGTVELARDWQYVGSTGIAGYHYPAKGEYPVAAAPAESILSLTFAAAKLASDGAQHSWILEQGADGRYQLFAVDRNSCSGGSIF